MFFDDRNTARATRARFRYQDECVALRCVANLPSGEMTAVVIEWSTDYIAMFADGCPELVSVKHRDPGTGEWTRSELEPVLRDLYRVWRELGERCLCVLVSSAGVTTRAQGELTGESENHEPEWRRFLNVLTLPDPPLPRRTEITAVGVHAMAGALSLMGRDEHHAAECYQALVERIEGVAVEQPPSPQEWVARMTGSLRGVLDRPKPELPSHTLRLDDLRELVLTTEAAAVRRVSPPMRAAALAVPREDREIRVGREIFHVRRVEETEAPDGSWRLLRADARQATTRSREVRLTRLDMSRPGQAAKRRKAELRDEARLHGETYGLPRVILRVDEAGLFAFATGMPPGSGLLDVYGRPPYPGIALDAVLRGLPQVARTLNDLHSAGKAHRALRPEVLIVSRDRMWLRDAGLAATSPVAGEGPAACRAPEQERPILTAPGPATDVYQMAAIVYHLATGEPPGRDPLPPGLLRPALAGELEEPILAALSVDPRRRPSVQDLLGAFDEILRAGGTVRC
jgi:hypothetical protein